MRKLYADIGVYVLLCALSVAVIRDVAVLDNLMPGDLGPAFFPTFMAWAVIVLCGLGVLRSFVTDAGLRLDLPGRGRILVTFGATIAFLALWQSFGHFYLLGFVYLSGLLLFFMTDGPVRRLHVAVILASAATIMVLVRLFFTQILYVRF